MTKGPTHVLCSPVHCIQRAQYYVAKRGYRCLDIWRYGKAECSAIHLSWVPHIYKHWAPSANGRWTVLIHSRMSSGLLSFATIICARVPLEMCLMSYMFSCNVLHWWSKCGSVVVQHLLTVGHVLLNLFQHRALVKGLSNFVLLAGLVDLTTAALKNLQLCSSFTYIWQHLFMCTLCMPGTRNKVLVTFDRHLS